MDEINEQRVEKVNRLKIAEKERDNLSGSKLEAEAFIEKEKEIRRLKNQLYQILEGSVNESIAELVSKQERTNEKLTAERGKLSETEKRLAVIQGEYEKVKAEHDKVNSELDKSSMVSTFSLLFFVLDYYELFVCGFFTNMRCLGVVFSNMMHSSATT